MLTQQKIMAGRAITCQQPTVKLQPRAPYAPQVLSNTTLCFSRRDLGHTS